MQARVNLLERTEGFDQSPWSPGTVTVTANASQAPNGTTTADRITSTQISSSVLRQANFYSQIGVPMVYSVYAKADNWSIFRIGQVSSASRAAWFDLSSGTALSVIGGTSAITNVGDGWYRCEFRITSSDTPTGTNDLFIGPSDTDGSVDAGAVGRAIYLWGAQAEYGSTATTYQRVTTATDYADIGLPRYLEFDGVDDAMATAAIDSIAQNDTGMSVLTGIEAISGEWPMTISQYDSSAAKRVFQLGGSSTSNFEFTVQVANSFSATRIAATARPAQKAVLLGQWNGEDTASQLSVDSSVTVSASATTPTITSVQQAIILGKSDQASATFTPGKFFQAIVRGKSPVGNLIRRIEEYVANKTGVSL